jgi:hypothetical protein
MWALSGSITQSFAIIGVRVINSLYEAIVGWTMA